MTTPSQDTRKDNAYVQWEETGGQVSEGLSKILGLGSCPSFAQVCFFKK